jgi:hypothetical protein
MPIPVGPRSQPRQGHQHCGPSPVAFVGRDCLLPAKAHVSVSSYHQAGGFADFYLSSMLMAGSTLRKSAEVIGPPVGQR